MGRKILVLFAILFLVSVSAAFYLYIQLAAVKSNPQRLVQEEVEEVVAKVGEIMVLPEDEEPTVAVVTDPERLKGQAFFEKAKAGDKILIYAQAGKVILYDPTQHKIIDVAPISIGSLSSG